MFLGSNTNNSIYIHDVYILRYLGTDAQYNNITESVGVIVNRDMQEATFHGGIARGLGSECKFSQISLEVFMKDQYRYSVILEYFQFMGN